MDLPRFLLDEWIAQKSTADPPIEFDLGSSTGPVWTLRELLALGDIGIDSLLDTRVSYTSAAGTAELRQAVAALEGVDPDHVQVVTGASEALLILFFLAAEPGANVVLPNPGFPANGALAESFGIETRYYSIRAANRFRVDIDEIRRLLDANTRIVFVNSPHNPTGGIVSDDEMQTLHDLCAHRGIAFVSDQVYHPIYHGPATRTAARLPHATVVSDFSKALCLSGLRLGWMVEHDAHRRERYHKARNYFTITGNAVGERLAAHALKHSEAIYSRAQRIASANLKLLEPLFGQYRDFIDWVPPQGGMITFPRLSSGLDTRDFCRRLMKRGVLIVPGDCFGEPEHFRLGFAASGEMFPRALERVADFLESETAAATRPAHSGR